MGVLSKDMPAQAWNGITTAIETGMDYLGKIIRDMIMKLGNEQFIKPLLEHVGTFAELIFDIVLASYYIFTNAEVYVAARIASMGQITVKLLRLINTIDRICCNNKIKFCIKSAKEAMEHSCKQLFCSLNNVTPNAVRNSEDSMMFFINTAIKMTSLILMGGLFATTGFKAIELRTNFGATKEALQTGAEFSKIIEGFVKEFITNEIDPDIKIAEDLIAKNNEWMKISSLSFYDIITDSTKLSYIEEALKEQSTIIGSASYNKPVFAGARSLIVDQKRKFEEMLKAINDVSKTTSRQATVGVLIHGKEGIGKSSICTEYLNNEIGKIFGWNGQIYNVDMLNYHDPYRGESFGIKNEMFAIKEDPFVPKFTKICSSDPYNFEGASLSNKTAPCHLKVLFMTTNVKNIELGEYHKDCRSAFWDRLIHYEVDDPQLDPKGGREGENPHRKRDFSHLKWRIRTHKTENKIEYLCDEANVPLEFTTQEVMWNIIRRIIKAEKSYLGSLLNIKPEMQVEIQERLDRLNTLGDRPNTGGSDFFAIRFQGTPGSGKTTVARKLARKLHIAYAFEIQESTSVSEFEPVRDRPMIYLLDDWVNKTIEPLKAELFIEKTNRIHKNSILIITSNVEFQLESRIYNKQRYLTFAITTGGDYSSVLPYDSRPYKHLPTGILRRIGLELMIRDPSNNNIIIRPPHVSRTYTVNRVGEFINRSNKSMIFNQILDQSVSDFNQHLSRSGDFQIIKTRPEIVPTNVDVDFKSKDAKSLKNSLKNMANIIKMYRGYDPDTTVSHAPDFYSNEAFCASDYAIDMDAIQGENDEELLEAVASRLGLNFHRCFPGKTFRARLETGKSAYIERGRLYLYDQESTNRVKFNHNTMQYTGSGRVVYDITPEDFARALESRKDMPTHERFIGSMINLKYHEFDEILEYYESMRADGEEQARSFVAECELMRFKNRIRISPKWALMYAEIVDNPVKYFVFGLLAMTAVGGTAFGFYELYQYLRKQKEESTTVANAMYYTETTPSKRQQGRDKARNVRETYVNQMYSAHSSPTGRIAKHERRRNLNETYVNTSAHVNQFAHIQSNPSNRIAKRERERNLRETYVNTFNYAGIHEHQCKDCNQWYNHTHRGASLNHRQMKYECPYEKCRNYYGNHKNGENFTHAIKIGSPAMENPTIVAIQDRYKITQTELLNRILYEADDDHMDEMFHELATGDCNLEEFKKAIPECYTNVFEFGIKPNMLGVGDMIRQYKESPYKQFHKSVQPLYVRMDNANGCNYAQHLEQGLFLTVGHAVTEVGELSTLRHLEKKYNARCVYVDRNKDEAIIYCSALANVIPAGLKRIVKTSEDMQATCGAFMRCGPTYELLVGKIMPSYGIRICQDNPRYRPNEYQIKLHAVGLTDVTHIIQQGDCGFPLVAMIDGQVQIIGFHNAYNTSVNAYFTAVDQERLRQVISNVVITNNCKMGTPMGKVLFPETKFRGEPSSFALPTPYVDVFTSEAAPTEKFQDDKLDWLGYFRPLHFKNNYKIPVHTHDLELENPNGTLPAAYTKQFITDYSDIKRNAFGHYDPGYTQIVKITPGRSDYDPELLDLSAEFVQEHMYSWYGTCSFLRDHEVLNGSPDGFLNKVDLSTSAGPLMKLMYKVTDKKPLFDVREEKGLHFIHWKKECEMSQTVRSLAQQTFDMLLDEDPSKVPLIVAQDCMKVENISAEKAKKGKVRIFNTVDLHHNLVMRKLFGDLVKKCNKEHETAWFAIGQDPYKTSTKIYKDFQLIDGTLVNTDYKNYDKSIHAVLIRKFVEIFVGLLDTETRKKIPNIEIFKDKLAKYLTNTVHLYDGNAFFTTQGNNSGVYITTLLNCVVNHILTMYSVIRKYRQMYNMTPVLVEVLRQFVARYMGDDRTLKVSHNLPLTMEEIIRDTAEFGMLCTPTKTRDDGTNSEVIDFCSREFFWDPIKQVVFPGLKKSSICGLLYWFKHNDRLQVIQNLTSCLYEAALHNDKNFFMSILRDVRKVADHYGVSLTEFGSGIPYTNFELVTRRHADAALGISILSQYSTRELDIQIENDNIYKRKLDISSITETHREIEYSLKNAENDKSELDRYKRKLAQDYLHAIEAEMALSISGNPISRTLELLSKLKITKSEDSCCQVGGTPDSPTWEYSLTIGREQFTGRGSSKSLAKKEAYELGGKYLEKNVVANSDTRDKEEESKATACKIGARFVRHYVARHIEAAEINAAKRGRGLAIVAVRNANHDIFEVVDHFHSYIDEEKYYFVSPLFGHTAWKDITKIYAGFPGVTYDENEVMVRFGEQLYKLKDSLSDLSDEDVECVIANSNRIAQTVRGGEVAHESPQATMIDPTVTPNEPNITSSVSRRMPTVLNPLGPPNMLGSSGVVFNLRDLVYSQYIDSDQEITFTDKDIAGTVLAAISIDPLGPFINPYIKAWVKMHNSYCGPIMVQVSIVGNPNMTSLITVGWMNKAPKDKKVLISELQKVASTTSNVCFPSVEEYVILDARQSTFYRSTADKVGDNVPHLVIAINTKAQSAFGEDKSVRIRIATRLANERDVCGSFMVSDPVYPNITTKQDGTVALNY
nr:MAG: hypothetical protein [Vespa velutina associated acypi-like virus]